MVVLLRAKFGCEYDRVRDGYMSLRLGKFVQSLGFLAVFALHGHNIHGLPSRTIEYRSLQA